MPGTSLQPGLRQNSFCRLYCGVLLLLIAALFGCSGRRRDAGGLPLYSFERGTDNWFAYGSNAKVAGISNSGDVRVGSGALVLEYKFVTNEYGSAVVAVPEKALEKMQSIRFWLKSDLSTAIGVVLSERAPNGGVYSSSFWSRADTWQHIELVLGDFSLNEGPTDARDPNRRLDPDQIQGIGVIDLAQYFQTLIDPGLPIVIDRHEGSHRVLLDDVEFSEETPLSKRNVIGRLDRGFITWITLGGSTLSISKESPIGSAALQWAHEQVAGKYAVITHSFANIDMRTAGAIAFDAASQAASKLVIYIEERNPGRTQGPRYKATVDLPGSNQKVHKVVRFADFEFDGTGPSGSAKSDPANLKSISLLDVTTGNRNTVWLSEIVPQ
jgi:hypothetical protein